MAHYAHSFMLIIDIYVHHCINNLQANLSGMMVDGNGKIPQNMIIILWMVGNTDLHHLQCLLGHHLMLGWCPLGWAVVRLILQVGYWDYEFQRTLSYFGCRLAFFIGNCRFCFTSKYVIALLEMLQWVLLLLGITSLLLRPRYVLLDPQ